jgi:hypothetical protein
MDGLKKIAPQGEADYLGAGGTGDKFREQAALVGASDLGDGVFDEGG